MPHLWYMMTETVLPVAEQTQLAEGQNRRFALGKAAHAVGLLHSIDERVEVVVWSSRSGDVTGARLHFILS